MRSQGEEQIRGASAFSRVFVPGGDLLLPGPQETAPSGLQPLEGCPCTQTSIQKESPAEDWVPRSENNLFLTAATNPECTVVTYSEPGRFSKASVHLFGLKLLSAGKILQLVIKEPSPSRIGEERKKGPREGRGRGRETDDSTG